MKSKAISFPALYELLDSIGFVRRTDNTHLRFEHTSSDTFFLLPKRGDAVLPHHVMAVRKILDERGLLSRDEFDRFLEEHSPRQSA